MLLTRDIERNKYNLFSPPIYQEDKIPEVPKLYIAWTGTYNQETAIADLQRNAGEESYRHAEYQIMQQVMQSLVNFKRYCQRPFSIVISGHSLGGALSQLMLHSIQRHLAVTIGDLSFEERGEHAFLQALHNSLPDYQHDESIGKFILHRLQATDVKELNLAVWNPTGVLQAVEDHSNKLARLLRLYANVRHRAAIGHVGGH